MANKHTKRRSTYKPIDGTSQKSDTPPVEKSGHTEVRIFQNKPGDVPLLEFLNTKKPRVQLAVIAAIERLKQEGHRLRPPLNEHLGDQLYYLRITAEDGTYRVFYWPHGKGIVVLAHGFAKKTNQCPPAEIRSALKSKRLFEIDPEAHTYRGKVHADEDDN